MSIKTQTRALLAHIKEAFMASDDLTVITAEPSDQFPRRWAAKRLMASVKVYIDGSREYFIELPDPV